jgi:replicative DNA helicase
VREIVEPEHFGIHSFGYAWQAMTNLSDNKMGIDVFTVADELERMGKIKEFSSGPRQGRALLSDLRANGEPRNALSYAELVQNYFIKRGLDNFFTKCVVWSKNGRAPKDIITDVNTELGRINMYSQQDEFTVPFSVAVSEAYDATDAASRGESNGIQTGIIDLDRMLGGLLPKNLYIVAGRPGQGKTALMLTVARNAAQNGKKVGIFSLEMSREQVAQRLIAQESGIDLHKIIRGKLEESDWPLFTNAVEVVASLPITINDLSSIKIDEVRQTSRKIAENGGLDLVIVDYIQLADSGKKSERRDLDVSEISRGLKYLSRELEVPVLAASQLSREIERRTDKKPRLSDLRESGSLEQDAYSVIFIHFPDDINLKQSQLVVAKHRNGPVGTVDVYFKGELTKFENATARTFAPERNV